MKKFVIIFQNGAKEKLYLPVHAETPATVNILAKTIQSASTDFWGTAGLRIVEIKEVTNEPANPTS